jgi:mono/diheme cytochrome c family protein
MIRPGSLALSGALALLLVGSAATLHRSALGADEAKKPYKVENGAVDVNTFHGYLFYGEFCLRCHGPDGSGSSYAPSLVDSLKTLSEHQFKDTIINGKKDVSASQQLVMPSFGLVQDVVLHLDDIYGYLKGRSDGVIPRGRPKRIGESE